MDCGKCTSLLVGLKLSRQQTGNPLLVGQEFVLLRRFDERTEFFGEAHLKVLDDVILQFVHLLHSQAPVLEFRWRPFVVDDLLGPSDQITFREVGHVAERALVERLDSSLADLSVRLAQCSSSVHLEDGGDVRPQLPFVVGNGEEVAQ